MTVTNWSHFPLKTLTPFLLLGVLVAPGFSQTQTVSVDDFESSVASWTRNDKNKLGLSDIVRTSPGATATSKGAALLTFKTAQTSWASLSRPLDGTALSRINADKMQFWINGNGDKDGVTLQLRGKNAVGADVIYGLPYAVRLNETRWRQVAIPLSTFRGPRGEEVRVAGLEALSFSQNGSWSSRFFSVDDIIFSGMSRPVATPTPAAPVSRSPLSTAQSVTVNADFKRVIGTIRASINPSFGPSYTNTQSLEISNEYRSYVAALRPRFARIDAAGFVDLADSSRPSFGFARLLSAVRRVQTMKATPLVCLADVGEWGLDARGYGVFCGAAARALAPLGVRYFELGAWSGDKAETKSLAFYNAGYSAIKTVRPSLIVGGFGAPAANIGAQNALLRGARGLDFLSVSFFGISQMDSSDAALIGSARTISPLKTAAGLLDKSRFQKAALFVTQANVSNVRAQGDDMPSEPRLIQPIAGAWWSQFMTSGSRLADQVFHSDASNPEWGFLDRDSRAYPAFYSAFLWNTFFPSGSERVRAEAGSTDLAVAAVNTSAARNLLLVNTTDTEKTAQIAIRGFPVLREVRLRLQGESTSQKLPTSPFQSVKLAPYTSAVVQFIEPPKAR